MDLRDQILRQLAKRATQDYQPQGSSSSSPA
jgi:hypothetical protein